MYVKIAKVLPLTISLLLKNHIKLEIQWLNEFLILMPQNNQTIKYYIKMHNFSCLVKNEIQ